MNKYRDKGRVYKAGRTEQIEKKNNVKYGNNKEEKNKVEIKVKGKKIEKRK